MTLPDGTIHAETRFTRLTGKSPILLAGMTPTTVDPAIVAAAATPAAFASFRTIAGDAAQLPMFERIATDVLPGLRTA